MRYILYLLSVVLAYSVALHAEQQKWFSHEVCKTLVDIGKQYDVLEAYELEVLHKAYESEGLTYEEREALARACCKVLKVVPHELSDEQLRLVYNNFDQLPLREPRPQIDIADVEEVSYSPRDISVRAIQSDVIGESVKFNSNVDVQNFNISNANFTNPGISSLDSASDVTITYDNDDIGDNIFEVRTGSGLTPLIRANDAGAASPDVSILNRPLNLNSENINNVATITAAQVATQTVASGGANDLNTQTNGSGRWQITSGGGINASISSTTSALVQPGDNDSNTGILNTDRGFNILIGAKTADTGASPAPQATTDTNSQGWNIAVGEDARALSNDDDSFNGSRGYNIALEGGVAEARASYGFNFAIGQDSQAFAHEDANTSLSKSFNFATEGGVAESSAGRGFNIASDNGSIISLGLSRSFSVALFGGTIDSEESESANFAVSQGSITETGSASCFHFASGFSGSIDGTGSYFSVALDGTIQESGTGFNFAAPGGSITCSESQSIHISAMT